ncbi:Cytochrome c oxidase subunit IV [Actinacidiphila alni]|uniref:cytochrome-c oxidase n=1 Tax=Actinacidiphila alni TaxID=380248 RepID=A0A1I2JWJ9_9ACTN|nr:cytochrome c oxidase subunit 4 [Actinacidiphila alni]SFF59222.1 Cytochrome c oxidase subunit IV [Actinacidiphila alni]
MRTESYLFGGVAMFFLITGVGYGLWSGPEPAGTAALAVAFVMSALVSFFFDQTYRRRGSRPEDRKDAEVIERAGPLDFFPARSAYPPVVGAGAALAALGIVFGLWLFLIGFGVLGAGVGGMVFQYARRGE